MSFRHRLSWLRSNASAGCSTTRKEMVVRIPLNLISHNRKIAYLYKRWCRAIEANTTNFETCRYKIVLARCEFDAMLNEKDMRKSKQMLLDKESQLSQFELGPIYFPTSPEGVAYNREPPIPDSVLDYWHPLEKAIYPDYFTRRELRKQQYIEMWEKQHGPPPPSNSH